MGSPCKTTQAKWEEALVRASRGGNDQAIETLFRRYRRQLLGIARRILRNTEDAEDALQDALLSAYRNVARFEGRSKFSTWLTRIVVNSALMRRRRAAGLQVTSLDAARTHLDQARALIKSSLAEARSSIWNLRSAAGDANDLFGTRRPYVRLAQVPFPF